jgi:hypothetical protein
MRGRRFGYEAGVGVIDVAGPVALIGVARDRYGRQCDN